MKKEKMAACGCWFGLVAIVGPIVLFCSYRIAHRIYDYHEPGGHHFGGADFAVFDAFAKALMLGPLIGIALALLTMLPEAAPRHWMMRSISAIMLVCIPFVKFTLDVSEYRARDLRIKEAHRRSIERYRVSAQKEAKQTTPSNR
jgi:hypothetical protein